MRILIAPHEIAGQMQLLASTFRRLGHLATAVNYYEPSWLGYVNDVHLGFRSKRKYASRIPMIIAFSVWAMRNYDIFHFFFGRSLFYRSQLDLPVLRTMGKKVFVHFRGSDIRNPRYVACKSRAAAPAPQTKRQIARLRRWQRWANAVFVSTPDLLDLVPGARLVPQAIDAEAVPLLPIDSQAPVVRIAHAPTNAPLKGTTCVRAAVDRLNGRGIPAELVVVEGVPHSQVRALYASCHIGLDQFLVGWYGNFSIEMMALGRPVVCFIEPRLRQHRPDLPLISATPDTLADVLEQLITDRRGWADIVAAGRAYVEQHHSARTICTDLLAIYEGA